MLSKISGFDFSKFAFGPGVRKSCTDITTGSLRLPLITFVLLSTASYLMYHSLTRRSRPEHKKGHHTTGGGAIPALGKENVTVATGANLGVNDVLIFDTLTE